MYIYYFFTKIYKYIDKVERGKPFYTKTNYNVSLLLCYFKPFSTKLRNEWYVSAILQIFTKYNFVLHSTRFAEIFAYIVNIKVIP